MIGLESSRPALIERWLPSLGLAAALLMSLASPTLATTLAPWPFLVAAVALGLPHGAADGVVLLRDLSWRGRLWRIAGYAVLMVLAALALVKFPAFTLLGFLALSWWHFGAADGESLSGVETPAWISRAWGFGRGGLAVSVPFAADPAAAWAPFARLAALLGNPAFADTVWLGRVAGFAFAAAVLAHLACALAPRPARPRTFEWLESGLILAVGMYTDPLFAVGCYFLMIHGFRQSAELGRQLLTGRTPSLRRRLAALHRAALWLLVPSWLALIALALWVRPAGIHDLAILSLVLYVVATPPHHLFHDVLR